MTHANAPAAPDPGPPASLAAVANLPTWLPRAPELEAVEVALLGVPGPVRITVPDDVGAAATRQGGLVLTDAEGTPLALVTPDLDADLPRGVLAGPVQALQTPEHGPFRSLRRSAPTVRATLPADALVVAVDRPLRITDTDTLTARAAGRPVVLLPLIGAASPRVVDATTLVRVTIAAAAHVPGAAVVPVPLPRSDSPAAEVVRRAAVVTAYGGTDPYVVDEVPGIDNEVDAAIEAGRDLTELFVPEIAAELRRARRPAAARGATVFFTGLSGSGKSTVARAFAETVREQSGRTVTLLDGDVVRRLLSAGLTFSRADRELNIRRIGFVAAEVTRHGGLAVCCPIAPYASTRAEVRAMVEEVGEFVLVYISTPLAECERRDRKGLYAKARAGLIPEFTGISDPYEAPTDADLVVDTTDTPVHEAVDAVMHLLSERSLLSALN